MTIIIYKQLAVHTVITNYQACIRKGVGYKDSTSGRACVLIQNTREKYLRIVVIRLHEGTLKWKSQEMTKAKTIQANKKFRNLWPCQKFRVSAGWTGAAAGVVVAVSFDSFHCSITSTSLTPETLTAVDPQISQVLHSCTEDQQNEVFPFEH